MRWVFPLLQAMQDAMESTQVALVLFSEEFLQRPTTKGKLKVLSVSQHSYILIVLPFVEKSCASSSELGNLGQYHRRSSRPAYHWLSRLIISIAQGLAQPHPSICLCRTR